MHAEAFVVIAGRRRQHEPRGGGKDQNHVQCTGSRYADASRDRLCSHGVDSEARTIGVDANSGALSVQESQDILALLNCGLQVSVGGKLRPVAKDQGHRGGDGGAVLGQSSNHPEARS